MQRTASPAQWPMVLIAGPGRRPISRSTDKTGRPISTRWRSAAAPASSSASIAPASSDFTRIGTTYTAQCGTLARVEINRSTGALRIAKAYSVFECGTALVPQVVIGQVQGAFAMGVGGALLETLPLYEDGPGNGKWNLGQYLVARGSDLPLRDLEIEMLPPVEANERPKGMSEVVMNPVVAALVNAIFDATGHRFNSLPVTQQMIKGVLT